MMVLGISGSHRSGGSTEFFLGKALSMCRKAGLETKLMALHGMNIEHCKSCGRCSGGGGCVINDDFSDIFENMKKADAIMLASPVYFANVSGKMKALMDRSISIRRAGMPLSGKIGGAVSAGASRNGGQEFAILAMHNWMLLHGMAIVSDRGENPHFGGIAVCSRGAGQSVESDETGILTCENLGKTIASEVLKRHEKK